MIYIIAIRKLCKCFKITSSIGKKFRHFWVNMNYEDLRPPNCVRGITNLDRDAFKKVIDVPSLTVSEEKLNKIKLLIKTYLLKMEKLKPIRTIPNSALLDKEILLHPLAVKDWNSLPKDLEQFDVQQSNFGRSKLELTYDNWRADEIFKAILPDEHEGLTSFSRIGHIVHINLRDHLIPFKELIGDVLRDKIPGCRTVVNKAQSIDNTYRNFQIELICGDDDYEVEVKENGVSFAFDFSKVYWNPRLSTEHERIFDLLNTSDVLYDVFAGVGPFSVPAAAKKKCTVLANDLNPESFNWLKHNAKKNKCENNITMFNKDGKDFIQQDLKQDLLNRYSASSQQNYKIHITMNLPAMAVEFLSAFRGLFSNENISESPYAPQVLVHVYCFAKGDNTKDLAKSLVESNLGYTLGDNLSGINFVRNVAPNKDMYRVSFYLTEEILFSKKRILLTDNEYINKKLCS